ncbi:hypothetical protein, partial [Escherichia coli]|uniref:hypothetical protein n=1 Tax=Escherichia coli TaxID=562 RepID=UPI001BDC9BB8
RESANYIGARSFRAAIKPDIKLQPTVDVRTMDAFANGMRSYKIHYVLFKKHKLLDVRFILFLLLFYHGSLLPVFPDLAT